MSEVPGMNSRLDELQAAILRVKLRYLDHENARRRELAEAYEAALSGAGLGLPRSPANAFHVYHQYVVRSERRDALRDWLRGRGVGALIHYPVPVHLQRAYRGRVRHGSLAVTEQAAQEVLSLPMYPELPADQASSIGRLISSR